MIIKPSPVGAQVGIQTVAWMIPKRISTEGAIRHNVPDDWQGLVGWELSFIGDANPVTDKHGVTHHPYPLIPAAVLNRVREMLEAKAKEWQEFKPYRRGGSYKLECALELFALAATLEPWAADVETPGETK